MQAPETRYARRSHGVSIGYQVIGSGPAALVFCWGWMSHLDLQWTDTALSRVGAGEKLTPLRRLRFDPPGGWRRRPG
jgi:hypothetical protein